MILCTAAEMLDDTGNHANDYVYKYFNCTHLLKDGLCTRPRMMVCMRKLYNVRQRTSV